MSGAAAPRGRGAGVNKPAWLVQQEREAASSTLGSAPKPEVPTSSITNNNVAVKSESDTNTTNAPAADTEERDQFGRSVGRSNGGGSSSSRDHPDDRHHRSSRISSSDYHRSSNRDRDHHNRYTSSSRSDHYNDRHHRGSRRDRNHHRSSSGRSDHRSRNNSNNNNNNGGIYFHSYEEERAWLEERRRKRQSRKSLFDVEPTPEQLKEEEARAAIERDHLMMTGGMGMGAASAAAYSMGGGMRSDGRGGGGGGSLQSQQTRHARRLYIGNIPDIRENDVHNFFREAIRSSIILDEANPNPNHHKQYVENDPIISVYINRERRCEFV